MKSTGVNGRKVTVKPKAKMGRPSIKTTSLIDEIIKRVISGQSVIDLTNADDMPAQDTIYDWLAKDQIFSERYTQACKLRRERKFYMMEHTARTEEDVQRARLIIDTVKWQLSKEEPKKYGDKVDLTTNGKDLPTPILGTMPKSDTSNEIIEGEVIETVPENRRLDQLPLNSNIMDDIS